MLMKNCLIPVHRLGGEFPFATRTLYNGKSSGEYTWLTREGPDGRRGRFLWLDKAKFDEWATARGISFRFNRQTQESEKN